jgi:hypothetical protein
MLTVLGGIAEFERDVILQRTDEGRARAMGEKVLAGPGPPPSHRVGDFSLLTYLHDRSRDWGMERDYSFLIKEDGVKGQLPQIV